MLNRRHKAILFITLVMTGSALLAGARLNQAFGMLMLGAALAWLVGSETASRTYNYLRTIPGKMWPSLRVLFLMALGGCLFFVVAVSSNFNAFLVAAAMSVFGMLFSPFLRLSTQPRWLNLIVGGLAVAVFFLATVGSSMLSPTAQQNGERVGYLAVPGLIALAIGMWWLVKGWNLILRGIGAEEAPDVTQLVRDAKNKGAKLLYLSLFTGTIMLTFSLGSLAFLAFSNSVTPLEVEATSKASNPQNPLSPVIGLMFLAWWPYASWKGILERQLNTTPPNVKKHKLVTLVLGTLFTVTLSVAITFGIQNGNDRTLTAQVEEGTNDFQTVAAKIGAIKSRDLQTTKDYIDAYEQIDPLLAEFDAKLQHFTSIISEAKQRDIKRGPLNIQKLHGSKQEEWLVWDEQMFELIRQDIEVTRKQVLVAKQMATVPEEYQVEFWEKNFRPLLEEEDVLRQKILASKASMPTR